VVLHFISVYHWHGILENILCWYRVGFNRLSSITHHQWKTRTCDRRL